MRMIICSLSMSPARSRTSRAQTATAFASAADVRQHALSRLEIAQPTGDLRAVGGVALSSFGSIGMINRAVLP